jgi:hypothetical protein
MLATRTEDEAALPLLLAEVVSAAGIAAVVAMVVVVAMVGPARGGVVGVAVLAVAVS